MRGIGDIGESIAEKYLVSKGARILARNYAVRGGEIDLIAELNEVILFVEVKLRRSEQYGSAHEAIPLSKQRKISRAAKLYLLNNGLWDKRFARFDALFILPDGTIEHIEQAFEYIGQ